MNKEQEELIQQTKIKIKSQVQAAIQAIKNGDSTEEREFFMTLVPIIKETLDSYPADHLAGFKIHLQILIILYQTHAFKETNMEIKAKLHERSEAIENLIIASEKKDKFN